MSSLVDFFLVESQVCPNKEEKFKTKLKNDEPLKSEWLGASAQDCQKWTLEKQYQVNFIEQDIIIIVDARSAEDDTLLIQYYSRQINNLKPFEFPGFGALPREYDVWYDFRIDPRWASEIVAGLQWVAPDVSFPRYFG